MRTGLRALATASGDLDPADVDSPGTFTVQTNVAEDLWHVLDRCTGVWSYTLNDSNAAVQALNTSSTPLHDIFSDGGGYQPAVRHYDQRRERRGSHHQFLRRRSDRERRSCKRDGGRCDGVGRPRRNRRRFSRHLRGADQRRKDLWHVLDRCSRCLELHPQRQQRRRTGVEYVEHAAARHLQRHDGGRYQPPI